MIRAVLAAFLLLVVPQVFAQATYQYTGPTFYTVFAPYTGTQSITGSFTVAQPLAANLSNADISGDLVALTFNDGQATRTLADTRLCTFRISTDGSGNITGHEIWLRQSNTTAQQNQHNIEIYDPSKGVTDLAGFGKLAETTCDPAALNPFANATAGTGFWTAAAAGTQRSIPLNASWAMLLMLSLIGFTAYYRLQRQS